MAELQYAKRWHTREDSGIRLDRDLVWWHDGEKLEHPGLIEAFNTGLVPADGGKFKLVIGNDWCFVEVEDAAYRVNAIDVTEDGKLFARLSDRHGEVLDPATFALEPDGVVTVRVKNGRAKARFSRDAQFALGELLSEENGRVVLDLGAGKIALPWDASALT